jgi:hypothetical protein
VAVLLGNGDGTFRPLARIPLRATAMALLSADLDGDGIPDLAVGQTQSILLFSGSGDGSFGEPLEVPVGGQSFGNSPIVIHAADVNLDGKPDLIVLYQYSGRVSLLVSTAEGGFRQEIPEVPDLGWLHDTAIADFNKDGKPDLAVCGDYGYMVLAGNGDGSFQPAKQFPDPARPFTAAAWDFNGDGAPDLILGNY